MSAIKVGDPQDATVEMGPVINSKQFNQIQNLLKLVQKAQQLN